MKLSVSFLLTDLLPNRKRFINKVFKNKIIRELPTSQVLGQLKKYGVNGIEVFLPADVTIDEIYELRKVLNETGTKVFSIHPALRYLKSIKIQELEKLFEIAEILSSEMIVIHINFLGRKIQDKKYISRIWELEKKYGIKVGYENREKVAGSFLRAYSWHEILFAQAIKDIDGDIILDTTHLAQAGGNIISFFKKNKERIANIHLSDYKSHYLNSTLRPLRFKHLPLGKGELPIHDFLQALKKEQYKGVLTLEVHCDLDGVIDSLNVINTILES